MQILESAVDLLTERVRKHAWNDPVFPYAARAIVLLLSDPHVDLFVDQKLGIKAAETIMMMRFLHKKEFIQV